MEADVWLSSRARLKLAKEINSTFDPKIERSKFEAWRFQPRQIKVSNTGCFNIDGFYVPVKYTTLGLDGQPEISQRGAKLLELRLCNLNVTHADATDWVWDIEVFLHNGCPIWQKVNSEKVTQMTSSMGNYRNRTIAVKSPCIYYGGHKQWHIGVGADATRRFGEFYYTTKSAFHTWDRLQKRPSHTEIQCRKYCFRPVICDTPTTQRENVPQS